MSNFTKNLSEKLSLFLKMIFGDLNYQAPGWLKSINSRFNQNRNRNFKILGGSFAAILILAVGGYYVKDWYDSRPQPDTVNFKVGYFPAYYAEKPEVRSLTIRFDKSVATVDLVGKDISTFIKMKPEIQGKWIWASDRDLKFTPAAVDPKKIDWPIGVKYKGSFSKDLFAKHILLKEDEFEFQVPDLAATISGTDFYQDPRFPDNKRGVTSLYFNYPIDPESIKKRITLYEKTENGKEFKSKSEFSVTFDEHKKVVNIQTSPLQINDDNRLLRFVVDKGIEGLLGGKSGQEYSTSFNVPSLYDYFKIESAQIIIARNEKFEPEQILSISNQATIASEKIAESLEVYELPYQLDPAEKKKSPYQWSSVSEITDDVMKRTKKLNYIIVPTEETVTTRHSFKIESMPGRSLYVKIRKNLESFGGFKLKETFESVVLVPNFPSDLQIMGLGSIIAASSSKKLPIVSRNLNKIHFTLNQIRFEQVNHFIPNLVYNFTKPYEYDIRPERIAEIFEGDIPLLNKNPQKSQYSSLDLSTYIKDGKRGMFYLQLMSKDSPEHVTDTRFILVSDLGIIVKKTNGDQHEVYVQHIKTGQPVAGARVSVLGQNGLPVLQAETGASGQVTFPSLKNYKNDKFPIAFVATLGESISFVPFQAGNREIDFSSFDVGGVHDSSESDQLSAFMFTDRGIYRPGEKVEIAAIVRSKNWNKVFNQVPVEFKIQNSAGQEAFKKEPKVSSNTIENLTFQTEDFFPTGSYTAEMAIIQPNKSRLMIGTTNFQVEEFVPDQIKLRSVLSRSEQDGWIKPQDVSVTATAYNLYGSPAASRRAIGNVNLRSADIYFKKWKDYSFNLPRPNQLEFNDSLAEGRTSDAGEITWPLKLDSLENSIYRMTVNTEVFETDGGRSVKSQLGQLVADRDYLIGYKSENLDLSFLKKDSQVDLQVIAIDSKLNLSAQKDIKVELVHKKPTSVLTRLPNDTYGYQTVYKQIVLKNFTISTSTKPTALAIQTDQIGEFFYVFKDADSHELNRLAFNVVGNSDVERGLEKSSILKLGLDKKDYNQNDEIEVQIKSPYAGAGLITIERDRVYATKWFQADSRSSLQKIKIPEGLEGQAYVVVTMLRDFGSTEIYTSPLAYGVTPFAINLEARRTAIDIESPDVVKSGQTLSFKVKANRKTKAVVYGVDEGILQVARYKLPQPVQFFFQKRALQVSTFQILDLVMPDFNLLQTAAAGGDEFGSALGQSLNPFKRKNIPPTAFWLGEVDLDTTWKKFNYAVPSYFNGNIKVMVVAADSKEFGSSSSDVNVRSDFIISATAPTFLAPQDKFDVNLIIANQNKGSGESAKVEVTVEPTSGIPVVGAATAQIDVPENKERTHKFTFQANEAVGPQAIKITAGIEKVKSSIELTMSLRPSVMFKNMTEWIFLKDSKEMDVSFNARPEFKYHFIKTHNSLKDLIKPFEVFYEANEFFCTEQIASRMTPLILNLEKTTEQKKKIERLISLLRSRQTSQGSYRLYPQDSSPNLDVTLHLASIFLYMQEKGEAIPMDMWERLQRSLKEDYAGYSSRHDFYRKAKALYILARTQAVPKRELDEISKLLGDKELQNNITGVAAVYLAATYKLMMQDNLAEKALLLVDKKSTNTFPPDLFIVDGFEMEKLSLYLRHFPDQADKYLKSQAFQKFISEMNGGRLNTYSASYLLMSLDQLFSRTEKLVKEGMIEFAVIDQAKNETQMKGQSEVVFKDADQTLKIKNASDQHALMSYVKAGFEKNEDVQQKFEGVEISRAYYDESGSEVVKVKVGQEITVKIRARVAKEYYSQLLISDLLPAGFEALTDSIRTTDTAADEGTGGGDSFDGSNGDEAEPPVNEEGADGEGALYKATPKNKWVQTLWPILLSTPKAYAQVQTSIPVMYVSHVDIREDRVNVYTSLTTEMREFTYKVKAVTAGHFRVPAVYARGLYRTDFYGQGKSGYIDIE